MYIRNHYTKSKVDHALHCALLLSLPLSLLCYDATLPPNTQEITRHVDDGTQRLLRSDFGVVASSISIIERPAESPTVAMGLATHLTAEAAHGQAECDARGNRSSACFNQ